MSSEPLPQQICPPDFVGDLLLTFGMPDRALPSRVVGPPAALAEAPASRLLAQPTGDTWRGYPLASFATGGWHAWLVGELYGHCSVEPLREELIQHVVTGRASASLLNGHFLLLAWDEGNRAWHVWTDRFGTLHAYHSQSGSSAAIGTFFPAVASCGSTRRLDWAALTGFFGFGFFPQDHTFYDDVCILPPASHSVFGDDGRMRSCERYVAWDHAPDVTRSYNDTVAEFGCVFGEVMADALRDGRIALPVSGGLDSRSTVAEIHDPSDRLWAFSYGYTADSAETRIARRVAECRGLPCDTYVIGAYLFERLDLAMDSVEGFEDITQCRQAAVRDQIAEHADYVIAAHWGDVWLDDMGLVGGNSRALDEDAVVDHALHKMEKRGRAWLLEKLARPHLGAEDPHAMLRDTVRQAMDDLPRIDDPDFRVKAFKTDNWSFRWTMSSLRMYQPAAFPRLPFYDTRVADFFRTVPSEFVAGRRLQIDYLKRVAPDLARVTWQARDADLYHCDRSGAWALPKRALKKIGRAVARRPAIQRNWEVQFAGERGRAGLQRWLLRPGLRLHDLVPPAEVKALLDAFEAAPLEQGRGYTVSMLLTFSAWLERFG